MCRGAAHVTEEARPVLADLLADICKALDSEHPERVVVGPVDFGIECELSHFDRASRSSCIGPLGHRQSGAR